MNIKGDPKNQYYEIALPGIFEQHGNMTGMNISARVRNDLLSEEEIREGKGDSAPSLLYSHYMKDGQEKLNTSVAYSKDQYDAMMAVANMDGDAPAIRARVFPKGGGLVIDTKSEMYPSATPYDAAKDKANTALIRQVSKEARAEKAAQEAQAQAQNEAQEVQAQADAEPQMG